MEMRKALDEILMRLHESYIEIDIHKTNDEAWKYYVATEKEVQASLSDKIVVPKKSRKQKRKIYLSGCGAAPFQRNKALRAKASDRTKADSTSGFAVIQEQAGATSVRAEIPPSMVGG